MESSSQLWRPHFGSISGSSLITESLPEGGGRKMLSVFVTPVQVAWTQLPTNPNVRGYPRKVPWLGLYLKVTQVR